MIQAFIWLIFSMLIGTVTLPLCRRLFSRLPGKGYFFAKPLGLLLWGFIFWWMVTLHLLQNDLSGQLVALQILLIVNLLIARNDGFQHIWNEIKANKRLIIWAEGVFLFAFILMALLRAFNPEIINTEKFMEMAFINAIGRSPSFPPLDPWLSGFSISYYYFGYLLGQMIIRITGTASEVGYNLIAAYWYAMTALGAYGVVFSLLARARGKSVNHKIPDWIYRAALLAPIMLLVVSNWHGFFDVLHSRGLFYSSDGAGNLVSEFWSKFNLRELIEAPKSFSWYPLRGGGWTWWAASRTVIDQNLVGAPIEIIDEFPAFSFILADIHPHVLNMPFNLLAIAMAFEALLGGWYQKTQSWLSALRLEPVHLGVGLITLGGLSFINTWDFPFYLVLIACSITYYTFLLQGWKDCIWKFLQFSLGMGLGSILLYLPFFLSFSSQAGGILPSFSFFTAGKYFWVMFGPFLVAILAYQGYCLIKTFDLRKAKTSALITIILFILGLIFTLGFGYLVLNLKDVGQQLLLRLGASSSQQALQLAVQNRLADPWTLLTIATLIFMAISLVISKNRPICLDNVEDTQPETMVRPETFLLFLVLLGALFAVIPEFVFLRDQFTNRMNTIFKFYFQAWILWSLAASYATIKLVRKVGRLNLFERISLGVVLLLSLASIFMGIYRNDAIYNNFNQNLGSLGSSPLDFVVLAIPCVIILLIFVSAIKRQWSKVLAMIVISGFMAGLAYPVVQVWQKTNAFGTPALPSLDGMKGVLQSDEITAVKWLRKAPLGVMAEANNGGQYSTFNYASTFSGMPSVLGWVGHESQWRGSDEEMGSRFKDLEVLYSTADWDRTAEILTRYNIRYIYVGPLEASNYKLDDRKFITHLQLAFASETVKIFENVSAGN
jgi:YYY domain-containing protein